MSRAAARPGSYEADLLTAARTVARLQVRRRRLRQQLKALDAELRHARKILRALASAKEDRHPDVIPSRVFGEAVGHKVYRGDE